MRSNILFNKAVCILLSLIIGTVSVTACTPIASTPDSGVIITVTENPVTAVPTEQAPPVNSSPSVPASPPSPQVTYISNPYLITPTYESVNVPVDVSFTWLGTSDAVSYEIALAEESGLLDKFARSNEIATTRLNSYRPIVTLKNRTGYWWRVRAVSSTGVKSSWSVSFFTTVPLPVDSVQPPPVLPRTIGEAAVLQVIDGDTIDVSIDGIIHRVRYIGIDTPEKDELYYQEATYKNIELVSGKLVNLEKDISETDSYNRLLRYVHVGNLFVNAELVKSGYAKAVKYEPDVHYHSLFLSFEQEAKQAFRGMWAKKYVGSVSSNKYHLPNCEWASKINPENQIWFVSASDAQSKGYVPCGVCKPPTVD